MNWKKHSPQEISAKLHQGDKLAAEGKRQPEIARTLGVTVMTYHRWRKARAIQAATHNPPIQLQHDSKPDRVRALQLENSRLRRLVTDLLLEKMQIVELLNGASAQAVRKSKRD
jgi:hypothetical protein